jgi:hypothetical protein
VAADAPQLRLRLDCAPPGAFSFSSFESGLQPMDYALDPLLARAKEHAALAGPALVLLMASSVGYDHVAFEAHGWPLLMVG